jgi:glutamate-1-semialdehyde aminotransferase
LKANKIIAAIIVEPVAGNMGCIPHRFSRRIKNMCTIMVFY